MPDSRETRRQDLLLDAVDPVSGKACKIQISYDRVQAVARRSMGHAMECGHCVPEVLAKPAAIFQGLCCDDDEDKRGAGWRCYCGIPCRAYHADGTDRPPYPGQVFLVFVNDQSIAYNWRWEKADKRKSGHPVEYGRRFKEQLL